MEHASRCAGEESPRSGDRPEVPAEHRPGTPAPIVERRLRDGTVHKVVKIFYDPVELSHKLAELGWSAAIELTDEGFIVGVATRDQAPPDNG
jgi:hypothetical protein